MADLNDDNARSFKPPFGNWAGGVVGHSGSGESSLHRRCFANTTEQPDRRSHRRIGGEDRRCRRERHWARGHVGYAVTKTSALLVRLPLETLIAAMPTVFRSAGCSLVAHRQRREPYDLEATRNLLIYLEENGAQGRN